MAAWGHGDDDIRMPVVSSKSVILLAETGMERKK